MVYYWVIGYFANYGNNQKGLKLLKVNVSKIDAYLIFRDWNDADLARALSVSPALICRIKKGKTPPTRIFIEKICTLMRVKIGELFYIETEAEAVNV